MKITLFLDTRRPLLSGNYPVKIRITHLRKSIYLPTKKDLSFSDFTLLSRLNVPERLRDIKLFLQDREQFVRSLANLTTSLQELKYKLKEKPVEKTLDAYTLLMTISSRLTVESRFGSAEAYRCAALFFQKYKLADLCNITPEILKQTEQRARHSYSLSTIGKYMRHLRAAYNYALSNKWVTNYPFGKQKYLPPVATKRKASLTIDELKRLWEYKCRSEREQLYMDLFFFSFFANGLNLRDVVLLQRKSVGGNWILVQREKTKNTSTREVLKIYITAELQTILNRYEFDPYVFGLYQEPLDRSLSVLRCRISRTLTGIARECDIQRQMSHGLSRHCFATMSKQVGVSLETISESLGHSSIAVTKHYLASFEIPTHQQLLADKLKQHETYTGTPTSSQSPEIPGTSTSSG